MPQTIAQIAYTAYCQAVGGKAFNGDPLPSWEEFCADPAKQVQVAAWRAAAEAVAQQMALDGGNPCPISAAVADQLRHRAERGLAKYGKTVEDNQLSPAQWAQHMQEELLDGAVYLEKLKRELRAKEKS